MPESMKIKKNIFHIVMLFIIVSLCWALDSSLTESPILSDAGQNLRAAYNIGTWGVFSTNSGALRKPSINFYREPLPPFVASFFVSYYTQQAPHLTVRDFAQGTYACLIKRVNIVWAFFVLFGSVLLSMLVMRNKLFIVLVVFLVYACFLRNPACIDTLLSELPTAALLLWTTIVFIFCFRDHKPVLFLAAGILLGLLTLTKALFLYIAALVVMGLWVYFFLAFTKRFLKLKSTCLIFFTLGVLLTTGPWLLRNKLHFDSFEISNRGGVVLYYRALKNTMNSSEILAAFHLWGPGVYKRIVKNTFLDVSDRDYEEGGFAARLNHSSVSSFAARDRQAEAAGKPELAITYYRITRANRVRETSKFKEAGHPRALLEADNYLKVQARRMIVERPIKHVFMTIPFAWRGIWCFYGGGIFTLLNAISYVAFVVIFFYGVVTKNCELILFCLLPMLMLFLYAFFTHNELRFSLPAIPFMIISFFMIVSLVTNVIKKLKNPN